MHLKQKMPRKAIIGLVVDYPKNLSCPFTKTAQYSTVPNQRIRFRATQR